MSWRVDVGDCVELMQAMPASSVDAVVCDPPYSLGFMGRSWDSHGENKDAGFGYYLAGLIDGEGHFRVGSGDRRCEFAMKMRADDTWILQQSINFIRHGRIALEPRRDGSSPQAKLIIDTKEGCAALCALLMRYPLRAKKLRDFLTWAEAVDEWLSMPRGNRWHGPADRTRLNALGARLREGRTYTEVPWSGNAFQDWCRLWATEALRVLKPGGHLLAFGGTRTSHRLACALEDAGFEIRDTLCWLYGSGFPKSLDVGKAIDKAAGAEREITRTEARPLEPGFAISFDQRSSSERERRDFPVTLESARWDGWGTALKPAHEPIVMARKPLAGTVAANVLEHGTGALNVDGCRIGTEVETWPKSRAWGAGYVPGGDRSADRTEQTGVMPSGRWPANVALDEAAAAMLDEQSGERPSGSGNKNTTARASVNAYGGGLGLGNGLGVGGDSGGASRFFYVAKASRAERNAGLDGFEEASSTERFNASDWRYEDGREPTPRASQAKARNHHPTVKPVNLMRWLVRLVTPPAGLVLDPFAGSGTTGIAAALEGFNFLGCEQDSAYADIARARIGWWELQGHDALRIVAEQEAAENEREAVRASGQMELL